MDSAGSSPILFDNADLFYGAAGWGLANLYFFDKLGDDKYLRSAALAFDKIKPMLSKDKDGYSYKNTGAVWSGLAHGASGIGYFALRLSQVTRREEHLEVAKRLFDFDLAKAEEEEGHVVFRRSVGEQMSYPYWRIGSAGIGCVAVRFHAALGDERYIAMARRIASYLTGAYSVFPTNFIGMGGFANFIIDMYRHTGEEAYGDEARRLVDRILLFAIEKPAGIALPGEDLLRLSTDYGTGSAGTGTIIHRIVAGGGIPYLDF
jgi:uncharacterized protein YyaL (SSP411 family)